MTIQTRESDDSIILNRMEPQTFRYLEDNVQSDVQLQSRWYSENSVQAVPMIVIPIQEGDWYIDISCEGYQAVEAQGGPEDKKWMGFIAYNNNANDNWNVGNYSNCSLSGLLVTSSWKFGHKDLELNKCKFQDGQVIERDSVITCNVSAGKGGGQMFLVGPPVMKADKYNYVVSYGEYTNKTMEFGSVTIAIDEKGGSAWRFGTLASRKSQCNEVMTPMTHPSDAGNVESNVLVPVKDSVAVVNNKFPESYGALALNRYLDLQRGQVGLSGGDDRDGRLANQPAEVKNTHLGRTHLQEEIFAPERQLVIVPEVKEEPKPSYLVEETPGSSDASYLVTRNPPVTNQPGVYPLPDVSPPLTQRQVLKQKEALERALAPYSGREDDTFSVQSSASNRSIFKGRGLFGKNK